MPLWWDRLLGRPSLTLVARKVATALEARGVGRLVFDPAHRELRTEGSPPHIYYLGNVFSDYARAPRSRRDDVIARFVDAMVAAEQALPATYALARAHVMPIVRSAGEDALAQLQARRAGATEDEVNTFQPASRPLFGELRVGLAYDTPHAIQRLSVDQLAQWSVSFDQALADALDNLRALPERRGWVALDHGLWSGEWGDDYESSRILLPDLIHRLNVAEPVVLTPLRRMLLVTSARNEAGLEEMARVARRALEEHPRWLGVTPMRLIDGAWSPFQPPDGSAEAFKRLATIERAERYASQKAALDELDRREGTARHVAEITLSGSDAITTWQRGVDTLLPCADLVRLVDGPRHLLVPWDALRDTAGALMTPMDMQPPRFRVRTFPDEAMWARLEEVAVSAL